MAEYEAVFYIESAQTAPFFSKSEEINKTLTFVPPKGMLISHQDKVSLVVGTLFNMDTNKLEVYTKIANIATDKGWSEIN